MNCPTRNNNKGYGECPKEYGVEIKRVLLYDSPPPDKQTRLDEIEIRDKQIIHLNGLRNQFDEISDSFRVLHKAINAITKISIRAKGSIRKYRLLMMDTAKCEMMVERLKRLKNRS